MKKFVLAVALIASLSTTLVSCSADDSDLQNGTTANELKQDGGILTPPKPTNP